ncbi:integrase arm-type DNA-binding domain-containing protein [uncultured Enterovirga sp.]|uniref:integrase arm-type DNA-binding domain-containing protein n=1 Tax=uncultured Enterovirga sp. TaxID=2026352 RepID=UPI0035CB7C56
MLVFEDEVRGLGCGSRLRAPDVHRPVDGQGDGPEVREPIGVWGSITIEQARAAARSRHGDVARGIDPAAERRKRKAEADAEKAERALTLEALTESWGALHLSSRRPRYAAEAQLFSPGICWSGLIMKRSGSAVQRLQMNS